jgi:hypothetical protein
MDAAEVQAISASDLTHRQAVWILFSFGGQRSPVGLR